jgi:hypothetical protein
VSSCRNGPASLGFGRLRRAAAARRFRAEYRWCTFDAALALVNYRGLADGLRSTREFITGREPPRELQLL